jgi:hypothetical protein
MTNKSHITNPTAHVQDRLCEVSRKVRLVTLAVIGMEAEDSGDRELDAMAIADCTREIEDEIGAIREAIYPPEPEDEEPEDDEPDKADNVIELVS